MTAERKPMVQLTTVWERTSASGNRYFSGFLGASQLLIFDAGEQPHPTREGETVHVWNVLLQERDQAARQQTQTRAAERGQRTWDRSREQQRQAERAKAGQVGEALLREAGRDFSRRRENQAPPQAWLDDSEAAIRDLEGHGR
jgi:hypothetical protein